VFISRDPVIYLDTLNLYVYVDCQPLGQQDSFGLWVNNQCTADCEDVCARQYPHWWQYHLYVGCVQGCNVGCQGQDFTLCSYINNWSDCDKARWHCLCGIAGYGDALLDPKNALGAAVYVVDCFCDWFAVLQLYCQGSPLSIGQLGAAAGDCLWELLIKPQDALENAASIVGQLFVEGIQELIAVAGPGNGPGNTSFGSCREYFCEC